eukprot:CCRYP_014698-RB/>CCRYP_014698-RB protein AED:0.23 eAED:0.70 QI:0/0/0/1/1/0.5/2/0/467
MKLHGIVSNPAYRHIICWMPHGRSWKILDKELLASVVCKKYFNHDNFDSFNRSVNGWGFKRLMRAGPDHKSYYHELFLRGRPKLARLMTRLINPGKRIPDPKGEPDFYEISKDFPLPLDPHDVASDSKVDDTEENVLQRHAPMAYNHSTHVNYAQPVPPYVMPPLLDPTLSKHQRRERFSFPPDNSITYPSVFPHEHGYGHYPPSYAPYPPQPYNYPTGLYGEPYGHYHINNPYVSPERHFSTPYNYNQYHGHHANGAEKYIARTGYEHHGHESSLEREVTAGEIKGDHGQSRQLKHDNNQVAKRQYQHSRYFCPPVIHHGSMTAESAASSHARANSYSHYEARGRQHDAFSSLDNPLKRRDTHVRHETSVDGVASGNVLKNGNSRASRGDWSEYSTEMGEQKPPANRANGSVIQATAMTASPCKDYNQRLEWSESFSTDVCKYVLGDDEHGPSNQDEHECEDHSEP